MANHNQNGGRNIAIPDENRPSWRPQDHQGASARSRTNEDDRDYRSWRDRNHRDGDRHAADRDPRRWEGGRGSELGYSDERDSARSTERYGQSGYAAGRYGDDRSPHAQNRNEMIPSPGSFEDRHHDHNVGADDRFTGGGRAGYWQDRGGHDPERYGARGGYGNGGSQAMGYRGGAYERGYSGHEPAQHGTQDDRQRHGASEPHVHRGTGPHRGKGPLGYQRSDERLRELVSEALADDDQIDASQILVSVKDAEVTLSGVVDDRRARRDAEDCVASIAGVRDVQVQLRVKDDRRAKTGPAMGPSESWDGGSGKTGPGSNETEPAPHDKKHRA